MMLLLFATTIILFPAWSVRAFRGGGVAGLRRAVALQESALVAVMLIASTTGITIEPARGELYVVRVVGGIALLVLVPPVAAAIYVATFADRFSDGTIGAIGMLVSFLATIAGFLIGLILTSH